MNEIHPNEIFIWKIPEGGNCCSVDCITASGKKRLTIIVCRIFVRRTGVFDERKVGQHLSPLAVVHESTSWKNQNLGNHRQNFVRRWLKRHYDDASCRVKYNVIFKCRQIDKANQILVQGDIQTKLRRRLYQLENLKLVSIEFESNFSQIFDQNL